MVDSRAIVPDGKSKPDGWADNKWKDQCERSDLLIALVSKGAKRAAIVTPRSSSSSSPVVVFKNLPATEWQLVHQQNDIECASVLQQPFTQARLGVVLGYFFPYSGSSDCSLLFRLDWVVNRPERLWLYSEQADLSVIEMDRIETQRARFAEVLGLPVLCEWRLRDDVAPIFNMLKDSVGQSSAISILSLLVDGRGIVDLTIPSACSCSTCALPMFDD